MIPNRASAVLLQWFEVVQFMLVLGVAESRYTKQHINETTERGVMLFV